MTKTPLNLSSDNTSEFDDDFGFSAVSEEELNSSSAVADLEKRLDTLYNAILPLLKNLEKNPDKEYILWPNRLKKIQEFRQKIEKIVKG